jgi:hypothetical protein
MRDISATVQEICNAGAAAMFRYAEVSGEDPFDDMPEHFLQSYTMDHLGDGITATIETGLSKLSAWNRDVRKRNGLPPLPQEETLQLLGLAEKLGAPRVDMVLFEGDETGRSKYELDILALVEFKKGAWALDSDRQKLLLILPHIDTCRYGVVCGGGKVAELDMYKAKADALADKWFQTSVKPTLGHAARYFFCARLFSRPERSTLIDATQRSSE